MDTMTPEQALEAAKGLTFEKVWAALMEDREGMKQLRESQQETQRQMQETQQQMRESQQETQRQMRESQQEQKRNADEIWQRMEARQAKLDKNLGGLNNSLGELSEAMFSPELCGKFEKLGFAFTSLGPNRKFLEGKKTIAEADFFLENGEYTMAVEIKTKLTTSKVDEHLERIAKIRRHMDARSDKRKIVGAVAGGIIIEDALEYAQSNGLYVIVQTGDAVTIADAPEGFKAQEW